MLNVKQAYNTWANQYDSNINKTRDLEAISLRTTLANMQFDSCLEIGCGTGKNTAFLLDISKQITAIDLSDEMIARAKEKIISSNVQFIQADILEDWVFTRQQYELVTFSLVLEHIENLDEIFKKVSMVTSPNALVYIGELHPFKQYTGSKARFDTEAGQQVVTCFTHHISGFTNAATQNGFEIVSVSEYFDDNDQTNIPRILTLLFKKIP